MGSSIEFDIKALRYHLSEEGLNFSFDCERVNFYYPALTDEDFANRAEISKHDWTGYVKLSEHGTIALAQAFYGDCFHITIYMEAKRLEEFTKVAELKIVHPELVLRCSLSDKPYWDDDQNRLISSEDPPLSRVMEGAGIEWRGVRFILSR